MLRWHSKKNINGVVNLGGNFMNFGKENETTEFKETTSELRQALMDMSAILNKHGKGLLYFDVKD